MCPKLPDIHYMVTGEPHQNKPDQKMDGSKDFISYLAQTLFPMARPPSQSCSDDRHSYIRF